MNKKIKKILFYISLIPLALLLIMTIYYSIAGYYVSYIEKSFYGFDAMERFLGDVYHDVIISIADFIPACIAILWIGYQIYYFITLKKDEKPKEEKRKKYELSKIVFFICILCWVIFFLLGIYAFFFGADAGWFYTNIVYGIDGVLTMWLWLLIAFGWFIPILPVTLLYMIIYLIIKRKNKKKVNNKT